jgi:hypothetical protein
LRQRHCIVLVAFFWLSASLAQAREILTFNGLAPVRIGMTMRQVERVLGKKLTINSLASEDEKECSQADRPGDSKASYMFHAYKVVRIDIGEKGIATPEGASVGTTESQLKEIYGPKATFSPHPYLDDRGHYVKVQAPGRELIFETEDGKVTSFRVGLPGAVELIEGCA